MCSDLQESVGSYEIRKAGCGCAPRIKGNPKCREAAADNAIYFGQEEGRSSTWPSWRTFSSRRSGLACAMRAAGCVASALGASGAGKIAGGAGANPRGATGGAGSARGRSKGDRLTNGRHGATTRGAGTTTVGGATVTDGSKGWVGGLGEASTGASAKGRGNSAERCR